MSELCDTKKLALPCSIIKTLCISAESYFLPHRHKGNTSAGNLRLCSFSVKTREMLGDLVFLFLNRKVKKKLNVSKLNATLFISRI